MVNKRLQYLDDDDDDNDDDDEYFDDDYNDYQRQKKKYLYEQQKHNSKKTKKKEQDYKQKKEEIKEKEEEKEEEKTNYSEILAVLKQQNNGGSKWKHMIEICEEKIEEEEFQNKIKIKQETRKNLIAFAKLTEDQTLNDDKFFVKLPLAEQKKINEESLVMNNAMHIKKPYRFLLIDSNIPLKYKVAALSKINALQHMDSDSSEFYKLKLWIDTFMKIPFNIYQDLSIQMTDGVEVSHQFLANAQNILNEAVYGLDDAKIQIMQMIGKLITNPKSIGTSIAIHGPPGTGKTSLVKDGISKILNRPFAFIALGGARDGSVLEGHSPTYVGSRWGQILQHVMDSKCMNPIIYFDELDKVSQTYHGDEIINILTHLTDTTQNTQFHDNFFSEFDFDLSRCLFIFSYNDESKINPVLRDRMYRIKTGGYSNREKNIIATNYLLPKIQRDIAFSPCDVIVPEETISFLTETEYICEKELGVRNLKRCLEIIYAKLNLFRLMKPEMNLFEKEIPLKVEFPIIVTKEIASVLIKNNNSQYISTLHSMYL